MKVTPMSKSLQPIPPGEVLQQEFMEPMGITQNQLARDLDVPVSRIAAIIKGERAITADTALRLAAHFGTSPEMWQRLQADYDLRRIRQTTWPSIAPNIRKYNAATAKISGAVAPGRKSTAQTARVSKAKTTRSKA